MEEVKPHQQLHLKDFDNKLAYMKEYQYLYNKDKVTYRRERYGKFPTFPKWLIQQAERDDDIGLLAKHYSEERFDLSYKFMKNKGADSGSIRVLRAAKEEYEAQKNNAV